MVYKDRRHENRKISMGVVRTLGLAEIQKDKLICKLCGHEQTFKSVRCINCNEVF